MSQPGLPLRLAGRGRTYGGIVAGVSATLLLGLSVPLVLGDPPGESLAQVEGGADLSAFTDADGSGDGAVGDPAQPGLDPTAAGVDPVTGAPLDPVTGEPGAVPGAPGAAPGAPGAAPGAPGAAPGAGPAQPGGGGTASGGGGAAPAVAAGCPGGGGALTASDVGVTRDSIKLGVQIPDVRALEAAGYAVSAKDPERQWAAVFDEANRSGGICGRKINYQFKVVDVIDQNRMREACLQWKDEKVFAVIGSNGFYGPALDCVVDQGLPFLHNQQGSAELYNRGGKRYFTTAMGFERTLKNWADFLGRTGAVKGQNVGIIYGDDPTGQADRDWDTLEADLKKAGAAKVSRFEFSADVQAAAGQATTAVAQFQREGVTAVLNALIFVNANQFVTQAQAQGAQWRYYASDVADATLDFASQRMPDSYQGAVGLSVFRNGDSRAGIAEPAFEAACLNRYRKTPGAEPRTDRGTTPHAHTRIVCTLAGQWIEAAKRAGANLTRDGWARGMQAMGSRNDLPALGGGTLTQGRFDMADSLRPMTWSTSCRCFSPLRGAQYYKAPF